MFRNPHILVSSIMNPTTTMDESLVTLESLEKLLSQWFFILSITALRQPCFNVGMVVRSMSMVMPLSQMRFTTLCKQHSCLKPIPTV